MSPPQVTLSRRERQIMDVIYRRGHATAAEVMEDLESPPSYSAVRALLRVLVEKGHLKHAQDGPRYVFSPTLPRSAARKSAMSQLVSTFFEGSAAQAVAALLDMSGPSLTEDEQRRLISLIEQTKGEGR